MHSRGDVAETQRTLYLFNYLLLVFQKRFARFLFWKDKTQVEIVCPSRQETTVVSRTTGTFDFVCLFCFVLILNMSLYHRHCSPVLALSIHFLNELMPVFPLKRHEKKSLSNTFFVCGYTNIISQKYKVQSFVFLSSLSFKMVLLL